MRRRYAHILSIAAIGPLLTMLLSPLDDPARSESAGDAAKFGPIAPFTKTALRTFYADHSDCALANVDIWFARNAFAHTFYLAGFDLVDSATRLKDEIGATVFYRDESHRKLLGKHRGDWPLPQKIADLDGGITYVAQPGSVELAKEVSDSDGTTILIGGENCRHRLRIERADRDNAVSPRAAAGFRYDDSFGRVDTPGAPPQATRLRGFYDPNADCVRANVDIWFAQGMVSYTVFPAPAGEPATDRETTDDDNGTTLPIGNQGCRYRVRIERAR